MKTIETLSVTVEQHDAEIEAIAETFLAELREGNAPEIDAVVARHSEHAQRLRELLPALALLEDCALTEGQSNAPLPHRLGDYEIIGRLGQGGMGVVYRAVQRSLGRTVALKVLSPGSGQTDARNSQRARMRFRREAEATAKLRHDHVVPIYDVKIEDKTAFYSMQWIDGVTVSRWVAMMRLRADLSQDFCARLDVSASDSTEPLETLESKRTAHEVDDDKTAAEAAGDQATLDLPRPYCTQHFRCVAKIGRDVAKALAHAHRHGIIHRDVKPSNILIDHSGKAWITDFGLAKVVEDDLTATGAILGTPKYMAPEQHRGEACQQSDVYSLGLTLAEMLRLRPLTGGPPDESADASLAGYWLRDSKSCVPVIPDALRAVVARAIAEQPADRFADADELAADLDRYLNDQAVRSRLPSRYRVMARRGMMLGGIVGVALAAGFLAQPTPPANEPQAPLRPDGYPLHPNPHDANSAAWIFEVGGMIYYFDSDGLHPARSMSELPNHLWNLNEIHLHGCQTLTREPLKRCLSLPAVDALRVGESNYDPAWLADLPAGRMMSLSLAFIPLDESHIDQLAEMPNLRFVNLNYCGISNDAIEMLTVLSRLEELTLQGNQELNSECLDSLKKMTTLGLLDIRDTGIEPAEARNLAEHFASLVAPLPGCDVQYGQIID